MDYGIGAGVEAGRLWMRSTDNNWYEVTLINTSASAAVQVNQTPLAWQDNSLGYQLLKANDSNVYQVSLSGSAADVSMSISQVPWSNPNDYKPYFFMRSLTDKCFYVVAATSGSGGVTLAVNQNSKLLVNL